MLIILSIAFHKRVQTIFRGFIISIGMCAAVIYNWAFLNFLLTTLSILFTFGTTHASSDFCVYAKIEWPPDNIIHEFLKICKTNICKKKNKIINFVISISPDSIHYFRKSFNSIEMYKSWFLLLLFFLMVNFITFIEDSWTTTSINNPHCWVRKIVSL